MLLRGEFTVLRTTAAHCMSMLRLDPSPWFLRLLLLRRLLRLVVVVVVVVIVVVVVVLLLLRFLRLLLLFFFFVFFVFFGRFPSSWAVFGPPWARFGSRKGPS